MPSKDSQEKKKKRTLLLRSPVPVDSPKAVVRRTHSYTPYTVFPNLFVIFQGIVSLYERSRFRVVSRFTLKEEDAEIAAFRPEGEPVGRECGACTKERVEGRRDEDTRLNETEGFECDSARRNFHCCPIVCSIVPSIAS